MKDLKQYAQLCIMELNTINIKCGTVSKWTINSRAKKRWGMCRALPDGSFEIQIAAVLLQDSVTDQALKDTIVHELLHTIPGCNSHTGKWRQLAEYVNRYLPMYHIKRSSSGEEKGIIIPPKPVVYAYVLRCNQCGKMIGRQRKSKSVSHPEKYRCICGGKMTRIK